MKFTSVIPTVQYGNIQPEIEIEGESYEEIMGLADVEISKLWDRYYNKVPSGKSKRLKAYVGGEIDYDEENHIYSWNGKVYQSVSSLGKKDFDGVSIAGKMADKVGVDPAEILKMWALKGEASRDFGNSMHKALQLFEQYRDLSEKLQKTYHLHDNFVLKELVESFYKDHKQTAVSEIVVVDHKTERAGRIDRLEILAPMVGRVADYKSGDVVKNLSTYWPQLNGYTEIMEAGGWEMKKPVIYGWNGEWKEYYESTK